MENWAVMGAVVLVLCLFNPPFFGAVIGAGGIMLATFILFKLLGG